MSIASFFLIFTGFINIFFTFFILKKQKIKKYSLFFALLTISISLWSFSMLFFRISTDFNIIFIWGKIVYVVAACAAFFFLMFSIFFPKDKKNVKNFWIFFIYLFFICILFFSFFGNFIISGVEKRNSVNSLIYNNGNIIYGLYITIYFFLGFLLLFNKYKKYSGNLKLQLKYIFIGTILSLFIGFLNNFILTYFGDFRYNWIGPTSTLILVSLTYYAIIRYRFMDINVIIRKTTVYFFTIILYLSIVLLAIYVTAAVGDIEVNWAIVWMAFFVAAILLVFFDKVKKIFTRIVNRYFFNDIVDYQKTITNLAKLLPQEIKLNRVVDFIVNNLMDAMKLNRAGVLLLDSKTFKYEIIRTTGFNKKNGISLITNTFLINYLKNHKQLIAAQELEFLKEAAKTKKEGAELEKLAKDMNHIEAGLCLPLFSADRLIGIIILGNKISNDAYSKEDLEMLEIVANQASIAIENAILYKKVQDFNKNLQKKVNKQTKDIKNKTERLRKLLIMRSEFLNITSHQLRTPVSVIKGILSMIKEGSIPKKREKEFLDSAFQRTVKLNEIINDILDASAIDSGKFEIQFSPILVEPILKEIYQEKKQDNLDLDKKIKLILDLPQKSLPAVLSNEKYLRHIFLNLINNAFQYTIKGSIVIKAEVKKDKIIIKIIDTGIGIRKDDIPKLFQKFGRAKNAIGIYADGSGLGLFIIKKIVNKHKDAKVYIEKTEIGKGSIFVLELPIAS